MVTKGKSWGERKIGSMELTDTHHCVCVCMKYINNKDSLHSPGTSIPNLTITYKGKGCEKECVSVCVCVLNCFTVHLKLTIL